MVVIKCIDNHHHLIVKQEKCVGSGFILYSGRCSVDN